MEILNKLNELSESLGIGKEKVEQVKSDVEAFGVEKYDQGKLAGIEEGKILGFEEGKKIGYDEGFAAGVASVGGEVTPPSDKIFSQAELDLEIQKAKDLYIVELEQKLDVALQQEVIDLKAALFKKPEVVLEVPVEPVV